MPAGILRILPAASLVFFLYFLCGRGLIGALVSIVFSIGSITFSIPINQAKRQKKNCFIKAKENRIQNLPTFHNNELMKSLIRSTSTGFILSLLKKKTC